MKGFPEIKDMLAEIDQHEHRQGNEHGARDWQSVHQARLSRVALQPFALRRQCFRHVLPPGSVLSEAAANKVCLQGTMPCIRYVAFGFRNPSVAAETPSCSPARAAHWRRNVNVNQTDASAVPGCRTGNLPGTPQHEKKPRPNSSLGADSDC